MLANITRVARRAADSAAQTANQVVDRVPYPGRRGTYPASMPVGRRGGGLSLAVTLLLALGVLWLASQLMCQNTRQNTHARQRGKGAPGAGKPLQTWEGEGGATPPAA